MFIIALNLDFIILCMSVIYGVSDANLKWTLKETHFLTLLYLPHILRPEARQHQEAIPSSSPSMVRRFQENK